MILNVTLKMIVRSWWRNKVFFLVSVASLALGLACTNLLMTYFVHEHGLEGSNPDRDRIVFLRQDDPMNEGKRVAYAAADIPQRLKDSYAEVEDYLRLGKLDMLSCKVDGQKVDGSLILLSADTTLTRFFDYRTAQGSLEQVLHRPDQVALSAACARKLFGGGEAFGRHIEVQSESRGRQTYQVAAVLEERGQSLLQFDMLTAQTSDYWGGPTLLKLSPGADAVRLADKINADQVPTLMPGQTKYHLDPLEAVCFTTPDDASQQTLDYISQTPVQTLYISLLAAVLILVIACCNYTNMSLSRLLQQLRMIHVEKLMGGTLRSIRLQLFGDAFLTVVLAFAALAVGVHPGDVRHTGLVHQPPPVAPVVQPVPHALRRTAQAALRGRAGDGSVCHLNRSAAGHPRGAQPDVPDRTAGLALRKLHRDRGCVWLPTGTLQSRVGKTGQEY